MQMNFDSTAAANPVMTLPAKEKRERANVGRRRFAYSARAALDRSESLENAAWGILAFVALVALVLSFAL